MKFKKNIWKFSKKKPNPNFFQIIFNSYYYFSFFIQSNFYLFDLKNINFSFQIIQNNSRNKRELAEIDILESELKDFVEEFIYKDNTNKTQSKENNRNSSADIENPQTKADSNVPTQKSELNKNENEKLQNKNNKVNLIEKSYIKSDDKSKNSSGVKLARRLRVLSLEDISFQDGISGVSIIPSKSIISLFYSLLF